MDFLSCIGYNQGTYPGRPAGETILSKEVDTFEAAHQRYPVQRVEKTALCPLAGAERPYSGCPAGFSIRYTAGVQRPDAGHGVVIHAGRAGRERPQMGRDPGTPGRSRAAGCRSHQRPKTHHPASCGKCRFCSTKPGKGGTAAQAQRFRDFYESNGWRVGQNPMRSWQAAQEEEKPGFRVK